MKIISRKDAIARGLKRYFTGKPCKHGHMDEQYVSGSGCVKCIALKSVKQNLADKGRHRRHDHQYRMKNIEKLRQSSREWYERNRDKEKNRKSNTRAATADLLAVLRKEMPDLLKEFGL